MATSISAITPGIAGLPTIAGQSGAGSIAKIADEFASLLDTFAHTANSNVTSAQSSGAPSGATGASQGGALNSGVTAFFFMSQTVNSAPPQAEPSTAPAENPFTPASLWQTLPGMQGADLPNSPGLPLFTRLDADQNGLLSREEFATAFGSNSAQAASQFASIDKNGTGNLDWSELNSAQRSVDTPAVSQTDATAQAGTTTTTIFAMFEVPSQQSSATQASGNPDASSTTGSTSSGSSASSSSTQSAADSSGSSTTGSSGAGSSSAASSAATDPSSTTASGTSAGSAASGGDSTTTSGATTGTGISAGSPTPPTSSSGDAASQVVAAAQSHLLDALTDTSGSSTTTR